MAYHRMRGICRHGGVFSAVSGGDKGTSTEPLNAYVRCVVVQTVGRDRGEWINEMKSGTSTPQRSHAPPHGEEWWERADRKAGRWAGPTLSTAISPLHFPIAYHRSRTVQRCIARVHRKTSRAPKPCQSRCFSGFNRYADDGNLEYVVAVRAVHIL
jgi:hypothetical protein